MADRGLSSYTVILLTLLLGMVLLIMPMPEFVPAELGFLRPDWVAMIVLYWVMALPHRVSIFAGWCVGILVDILLGSLLGQHALAYVIICYIVANLYQRLRMFTVWQQALILFVILGVNQLLNFWVESFAGLAVWSMWYLMPALVGALLWPWVFLTLRFLRRRYVAT